MMLYDALFSLFPRFSLSVNHELSIFK